MKSQAETTINHVFHPHPLKLLDHQNPQATPTCSGCKLPASGMIYGCRTCKYFLHPNCAKMPQQITHPFDQHVLVLHPQPPYQEGLHSFCDACGKPGQGFCYHCKICKIDLHILCAVKPLHFTHQSHCHQLKLHFSPPHPDKMFNCDICYTLGSKYWLYRCDMCDFDVHLDCSNVSAKPVKPGNMHQYQTNFGAFPNQTPMPQAQSMQQPGFGATAERSAPQVPPHQAPHYQHFHPSFAATGIPVNHGFQSPAVTPFAQRQNHEIMLLLQKLQDLLNSSGQNGFNHNQLQALLAGGGVGGGVGGVGGGAGGLGGFGGPTGGHGGLQNLITQALSGVGNGVGGNIPGLDFLGNGGGLNILQGFLGGGGNGLDVLGGLLGQFL